MTNEQMAVVFTEWERRWREEPERFMSEFRRYTLGIDEYGARAARYFEELSRELSAA